MPNKFTATHDGKTFKRTSKNRTYSHCVVARVTEAGRRGELEGSIAHTEKVRAEYQAAIDAAVDGVTPLEAYKGFYDVETVQGWVDGQTADIARKQEALAKLDGPEEWGAFSWVGRPDLIAARVKEASFDGFREVVVVEAVQA